MRHINIKTFNPTQIKTGVRTRKIRFLKTSIVDTNVCLEMWIKNGILIGYMHTTHVRLKIHKKQSKRPKNTYAHVRKDIIFK